jgi:hypothetical protein
MFGGENGTIKSIANRRRSPTDIESESAATGLTKFVAQEDTESKEQGGYDAV